jgi:hypothetical protein
MTQDQCRLIFTINWNILLRTIRYFVICWTVCTIIIWTGQSVHNVKNNWLAFKVFPHLYICKFQNSQFIIVLDLLAGSKISVTASLYSSQGPIWLVTLELINQIKQVQIKAVLSSYVNLRCKTAFINKRHFWCPYTFLPYFFKPIFKMWCQKYTGINLLYQRSLILWFCIFTFFQCDPVPSPHSHHSDPYFSKKNCYVL